jgi:Na+-transporting methylmalonyl-CoA/oxaloacetate decarboxylase gamma subunit
MIVAIFVFAAIVLCVLLILVALVSVASRREDRAWTLTEPASGAARSVARRLLGLRSRNAEWLQQAGRKDRRRVVRQPTIPWEIPDD